MISRIANFSNLACEKSIQSHTPLSNSSANCEQRQTIKAMSLDIPQLSIRGYRRSHFPLFLCAKKTKKNSENCAQNRNNFSPSLTSSYCLRISRERLSQAWEMCFYHSSCENYFWPSPPNLRAALNTSESEMMPHRQCYMNIVLVLREITQTFKQREFYILSSFGQGLSVACSMEIG